MKMNLFDKACAILALLLGLILLGLGAFGIFTGCHANFTLPRFWGGIPLIVGWGIIKSIFVAWSKTSSEKSSEQSAVPFSPEMSDVQQSENFRSV